MNDNQRRQIDAARRESEAKSYCIDAAGMKSMGHSMPMHMQADKHEMMMNKNEMPMYQKDGVS